MEPNQIQNIQSQNMNMNIITDSKLEDKPFCDSPFEEVEDGYIDDRGFYTTPNGSFWDDDKNYFNHLGFDKYGGSYDKYGVYQPGTGYDENTGLYNDQKEYIENVEMKNCEKNVEMSISKLRDQEKKDEKTIKKYMNLEEESEESDEDDDGKSNITFDENDIKEAYENIMNNENNDGNIINNQNNNI